MARFKHIIRFLGTLLAIPLGLGLIVALVWSIREYAQELAVVKEKLD